LRNWFTNALYLLDIESNSFWSLVFFAKRSVIAGIGASWGTDTFISMWTGTGAGIGTMEDVDVDAFIRTWAGAGAGTRTGAVDGVDEFISTWAGTGAGAGAGAGADGLDLLFPDNKSADDTGDTDSGLFLLATLLLNTILSIIVIYINNILFITYYNNFILLLLLSILNGKHSQIYQL